VTGVTLHLYAVVLAETALPEDITGVQGQPVDVVPSDDLAAVVSTVDAAVEATETDAVAHLDVITSLLDNGPVIPMRFGTIAPDTDAVRREVIEPSRHEFAEHLRATSDVVEVLVTIELDEDAAIREILSRDDRSRSSAPWHAESLEDRIALGEDIAGRLSAAVQEWSDELVRAACGHTEAVVSLDTAEHTSVRLALLVRRDRLADVDAELRQLAPVAGHSVPYDIEYVGPLPPLDFPLQTTTDDSGSSLWGW
jgi:gas vesicle protein GvpL/GvpF